MGKKGVMTVMWKSQEENEREGVYFDGCHRNNQELTGIVSPSKKKNLSVPSSNPTFSLPSHAFLRDTTSNNYNKVPSTSFNQKRSYFQGIHAL